MGSEEESTEIEIACEICGGSTSDFCILPLKQPDGKLDTLACRKCAEQSGAFCVNHQWPHLGFEDGTTACRRCIEEKVESDTPEILGKFFQEVKDSPHREEIFDGLERWSQKLFEAGLPYSERNISRAIVSAAFRFNTTPEEMINQICEEGLKVIFPNRMRSMLGLIEDTSESI